MAAPLFFVHSMRDALGEPTLPVSIFERRCLLSGMRRCMLRTSAWRSTLAWAVAPLPVVGRTMALHVAGRLRILFRVDRGDVNAQAGCATSCCRNACNARTRACAVLPWRWGYISRISNAGTVRPSWSSPCSAGKPDLLDSSAAPFLSSQDPVGDHCFHSCSCLVEISCRSTTPGRRTHTHTQTRTITRTHTHTHTHHTPHHTTPHTPCAQKMNEAHLLAQCLLFGGRSSLWRRPQPGRLATPTPMRQRSARG